MKKYYDIGTQEPKFEIGSKVLLHDTATKPGEFLNLRKDGSELQYRTRETSPSTQ